MTQRVISGAGAFGDYYDGQTAQRQRVGISVDNGEYGHVLMLELPDGEHVVLWPVALVRTLPDQSNYDTLTMGLKGGDGSRLVVRAPDACRMIAEACPNLSSVLRPPPIWRKAITTAVAGAVAIVLLFTVFMPGLAGFLARQTTPEAEVAMGSQHFELTRAAFSSTLQPLEICVEPAGLAAMEKITERVSRRVNLPYPLKVAVLDDSASPVPNAYALPGGYITFFNTLIQLAEDPNEIAAVYAHELGHVVLDHSVKGVLQQMTTLIIVTLLTGDVTGGAGFGASLISSGYSRAAETEADVYAQNILTEVELPPSALGTLFARMAKDEPRVTGVLAHLSSHPEMADRIAAAAAADTGYRGLPVLTREEWAALRNICSVTRP